LLLLAALVLGSSPALAQPAPQQPTQQDLDKMDAKALMQSGLRLFEAKDYLGALAVFRGAYRRFPSAKILLNIGTTLKELGRDAEAANAYQRYVDSPDSDPGKRASVLAIMIELDKRVGRLEITVTPPDAQIQVNTDEWIDAAGAKVYRVVPGQLTVNVRKDKHQSEAKQAQIAAGETAQLAFTLTLLPEETKPIEVPVVKDTVVVPAETTRSRIGVLVIGLLDVPLDDHPRGGAVLVGATGDITRQLRAQAALIVGPTAETDVTLSGAYAGASFAFLSGNVRPIVSAGLPVFFSNGARFAVRGAGGVEYQLNKHVSFIAELGLEYVFNPEEMYESNVFVPAIGASGRL
jgi:hypothetical protein